MKIIILESQVIEILKEQMLPQYKEYMDKLLDKMSSGKSLSDEEKDDMVKISRGENLEEPQTTDGDSDEEYSESDPYIMFMEIFPDSTEINVDDEYWVIQKDVDPDLDLEGLLLMSQDRAIFVHPFFNGDKFVIKKDDENLQFTLNEIPKTPKEMETFVDIFIKRDLKGLVQRLIKKQ